MTDPAAYYLQPLSWHQLATRPETYELRAIPGPVAVLTFRRRHEEALVRSPYAEWRFVAQGLFRRTADILLEPQGKRLGTCRLAYWTARGSLAIRPTLSLAFTANSWDKTYSVTTQRGDLVFAYDFRGFFSLRAPLTWGPAPSPAEDFPWLIPFAWFLAVRYYRQVIESAGGAVLAG